MMLFDFTGPWLATRRLSNQQSSAKIRYQKNGEKKFKRSVGRLSKKERQLLAR